MSSTYNYLNIEIHRKNPEFVSDFSKTLLEGHYTRAGESIPQAFARAATTFCFGDYALAQRIYNYAYNNWFMYASPVLSNATKGRWVEDEEKDGSYYWYTSSFIAEEKQTGQPISCFAFDVPDTAKGQVETIQELATLSMIGGGTGAHNSIRGVTSKAPGPIPYMKVMDSAIGYFKQGHTRRGALAYYLDVDHPDIVEHIKFRVPGGDAKRRSDNRQQFHSAVNLTDKFIEAVENDSEYDLVCPHSGKVYESLRARSIWELILETRALTGEPYLLKTDAATRKMPETQRKMGLRVKGSNLCVTPDTLVLTDEGHLPIGELEGKSVNVWNGQVFSKVEVAKTGVNQSVVRVITDSGQELECTPYHKFYLADGYTGRSIMKRAHELKPGDKLIKEDYLPVINGEKELFLAYQNGFFSGDGCSVVQGGRHLGDRVYLYGSKRALREYFYPVSRQWAVQESSDREYGYIDGLMPKFFVPDSSYTVGSRIRWLEGLLDADGTVHQVQQSQTLALANTQEGFLKQIQLMLQTLGVNSKIKVMHEAKTHLMPKNDGSGELGEYPCQKVFRLLISGVGVLKLQELGFTPKRLQLTSVVPDRQAAQFVKVVQVIDEGKKSDTFCFTEPLRGMGMFNGILTGNCSEIVLPTNEDRTFVCCLSSLNLEKYEEWKDTPIVEDLIRFLDNVLQWFISNAPDSLRKAKYSAERERALGLGTFGWHSLLQSKMIPFEGGGFNSAVQLTHEVFSLIERRATASSRQLALERGEAPDMIGTGLRNSRRTAIAPNSNSADIANTSAAIEPWYRNIFVKDTRVGSFTIKNKYLEQLLESKGMNTKAVWSQILADEGSVANLDGLTDHEKAVFKTASEMDQHWLVELADQRGRYICQAQSLNLFFLPGASRAYINSVHLKFLRSQHVYTLYYYRTNREAKVDSAKTIERKALTDWSGAECVACQG